MTQDFDKRRAEALANDKGPFPCSLDTFHWNQALQCPLSGRCNSPGIPAQVEGSPWEVDCKYSFGTTIASAYRLLGHPTHCP